MFNQVAIDEDMLVDDESSGGDISLIAELTRRAAAGRVLLLLDGLDEVHGVGSLATLRNPAAAKVQKLNISGRLISTVRYAN